LGGMAKRSGKPGRPPVERPKSVQLRMRLDQALSEGLDSYQRKHFTGDRSETVRQILVRVLKEEGLLK
jgi:hypothetical protein